jgi:hypothetical protein
MNMLEIILERLSRTVDGVHGNAVGLAYDGRPAERACLDHIIRTWPGERGVGLLGSLSSASGKKRDREQQEYDGSERYKKQSVALQDILQGGSGCHLTDLNQ